MVTLALASYRVPRSRSPNIGPGFFPAGLCLTVVLVLLQVLTPVVYYQPRPTSLAAAFFVAPVYSGFFNRFKNNPESSTKEDNKPTESSVFPMIQQIIQNNNTQDDSTLQELNALDLSLQRLAAAKEEFMALIMMSTTESQGDSSSTRGATLSWQNTDQNDSFSLDELEKMVLQLEEEAEANTIAEAATVVAESATTTSSSGRSIEDYQAMITELEAQVEKISKDQETLFVRAMQKEGPVINNETLSFELRSLKEIRDLAIIRAADPDVRFDESAESCITVIEEERSEAKTKQIALEYSNFTLHVSTTFAEWKEELSDVLNDVQQDGGIVESLDGEFMVAVKEINVAKMNGEPNATMQKISNGMLVNDDVALQKLSLLSRFREAWTKSVQGVQRQMREVQDTK